jgi:hypothetical protein
MESFVRFCQKVQYVSDPSVPLVLKSCPDYRNFLFIKSKIPNAKFVFLFRHPLRLLDSQLRIFQKAEANKLMLMMSKRYSITESPVVKRLMKGAFSDCFGINPGHSWLIHRMKVAEGQLFKDLPFVERKDYIFVGYEDLMVDAQSHVQRILAHVGETCPADVNLNPYIQPRKFELLPDIQKRQEYLLRLFQKTRDLVGYDEEV